MQELRLQLVRARESEEESEARDLVIRQFPSVVGRHPACDHSLSSPLSSRRHCSFFRGGEQVWVQDLGSRNGTQLNGEPVTGARPLHDGDLLQLAALPFLVRLGSAPGRAPEETRRLVHGIAPSP